MLAEKISQAFTRHPQTRVLFFFDEAGEYKDEFDRLDLEDVQTLSYSGTSFGLKWKLLNELKEEKTALYLPMKQPSKTAEYREFPLLGIMLANRVLQLGDVGEFMDTYNLQRHQRSLVSKYMTELKYGSVQEVCRPILRADRFEESVLQRGLLSAFLRFRQIESWSLITAKLILLAASDDAKEWNRVMKKIQGLGMEDVVLEQIERMTCLRSKALDKAGLLEQGRAFLYNRIMQHADQAHVKDPYRNYKITDPGQLTVFNQMLHDVERSPMGKDFGTLLETMSKDIRGVKLMEVYGVDEEFAHYTRDMIWALISASIQELEDTPTPFYQRLERISLQDEIPSFQKDVMEFLVQCAKMDELISTHTSYTLDQPDGYIQDYVEGGFRVDAIYRRAIHAFKQLDMVEVPENLDLESIKATLNDTYETHVEKLNREWLRCLAERGFDYKGLIVPKQYDFYDKEVREVDQKLVVIISDALRYEAGHELLSALHGDPKNTAVIRHQLASIPSKTIVGMCQLLPGKKSFDGKDARANEISTEGIANRAQILSTAKEDSVAITFKEVNDMSINEQREVFKNQLVYVYHDVIDARGDKRNTEREAFNAVEDAVQELKKFIKSLHASLNVARVLVTADHGFLYSDRRILDREKEDMPITDCLDSHNRYVLTGSQQEMELGYSLPMKATTAFENELWVNIPYSVNRYKKQGVGHQFVHGGGSLQELIVPIIESTRMRVEVSKKVQPRLIDKRMSIVSNILKVDILQDVEVSGVEKECSIKVGLYDGTELVSNQESVLLNSTSENPSERMYRTELVLSSSAPERSFFLLKIFDEEDRLNPLIEKRVQNSTLIKPDF